MRLQDNQGILDLWLGHSTKKVEQQGVDCLGRLISIATFLVGLWTFITYVIIPRPRRDDSAVECEFWRNSGLTTG
jgi:hypothetical protein